MIFLDFYFDVFFLGLKKWRKNFWWFFCGRNFFVQIFSSKFLVVIKIFFDFFELKKWGEQNGWLLFNFDFSGCCFLFVSIRTGWKFCVMNFAFVFWMARKIEEWIDSVVVFVCVILFVFLFMGNLGWNIFGGSGF